MTSTTDIDPAEVIAAFRYYKGRIYHRTPPKRGRRRGYQADTTITAGYRRCFLNGRHLRAHRVAWLLHHGQWPTKQLDHINGKRNDNRIANLREATSAENNRARRAKRSTTGYIGVHRTPSGKYVATIAISRRNICVHALPTAKQAAFVRDELARFLHREFAMENFPRLKAAETDTARATSRPGLPHPTEGIPQ